MPGGEGMNFMVDFVMRGLLSKDVLYQPLKASVLRSLSLGLLLMLNPLYPASWLPCNIIYQRWSY